MADLLFILFKFNCFANVDLHLTYLFGWIQTSQTEGQPYRDTSQLWPSAADQKLWNDEGFERQQ